LSEVQHLYLNSKEILSSENLNAKNVGIKLGVPYLEYSDQAHPNRTYLSHLKAETSGLPLQGYTHIIPNITLSKYEKLSQLFHIKGVVSFNVKYSPETFMFEINQDGIKSSLFQIHLTDLINKLGVFSTSTLHNNLALTTVNKNGTTIQIIFTDVTASYNSDKSLIKEISDVRFIILIKRSSKK
jgi:hypothetical protein